MDIILEAKNLKVHYGRIQAVRGIDLKVHKSGVTALLGANGAGKTSTVMAIVGAATSVSGQISIFGKDFTNASPDEIIRAGVAITPEGRRIFSSLTVEENLILAGYSFGASKQSTRRSAMLLERFPILGERRYQLAGLLSGGEQQMLAVARALICDPKLILMDEPSLGLAPQMVDMMFSIIEELRVEGISILLVEQNAALALEIADHAVVLANGKVAASGVPSEIMGEGILKSAYLAA